MATFGDLQTAVSKRLLDVNNVAVGLPDVAQAINDAISYWKFRRFWFNQLVVQLTMTATDGTIPLPADFLVPYTDDGAFQIEYSDQRYPLSKITTQEYDGIYLANGFGIPISYARIGQSFETYPLPDRNYQINVNYLKNYAALVNTTDYNDFTVNASRLITLWTCANLIGELRQDEKMEAYYRQGSKNEYDNMDVLSDKNNGSGKLSVCSALM